MEISQVFITVVVVVARFELVACNMDLKCKAREGCHFSGCDPSPVSLSSLDRNEFPITCQGNPKSVSQQTQRALAGLLSIMSNQDKKTSQKLRSLESKQSNMAKDISLQTHNIGRINSEVNDLKKSRDDMSAVDIQLKSNNDKLKKEVNELKKSRDDMTAIIVQLKNNNEKLSKDIRWLTLQAATLLRRNNSEETHLNTSPEDIASASNTRFNEPQAANATARTMVTYSNCRGVNLALAKSRQRTGGVFNIAIPGFGTKEAYCNTEVDGGGWIVFQRRMDGSVDFYRNWVDYVIGFGDAKGEYWLGLEPLHQLTNNANYELRIDMIIINGTYLNANYRSFEIGPASGDYQLAVIGYSGNATDSLKVHNGQAFTTKDNDNDKSNSSNCAVTYTGA